MSDRLIIAAILAAIWGALWALFLQRVPIGRFWVLHRTWLTVVVGVGVDLLILVLVLPLTQWLIVSGIIASSSIGIITRSVINEFQAQLATIDALDKMSDL